jgi:putative transposase
VWRDLPGRARELEARATHKKFNYYFCGMDQKTFYRRNLPHFTPNDAPYFVTYRLAGSLPKDYDENATWKVAPHSKGRRERSEAHSMKFRDYDRLLDAGKLGPHWLKNSEAAKIVFDSLQFFDGERYQLWAATIMSNHVHVVFTLRKDLNLWDVLHSLKSYTANECNKVLGRRGAFWQHESYDHVVREYEFANIIFYILRNPVKAGLCQTYSEWPYSYVSPELHGFDETEYLQFSI